jgi:hypothetical protein
VAHRVVNGGREVHSRCRAGVDAAATGV